MLNFAIIGNPNTGKTSLFNMLTDSYAYVGNWTGVTVEKKVGLLTNKKGQLTDLPGVYSLNPLSKDEAVTSNYFMEEDFTSIINVVDASQLERNLHLTIQLLEFGKPLRLALNMVDVAEQRGIKFDTTQLSSLLRSPVIPVIARTGKGCDRLLESLTEESTTENMPLQIPYGEVLEDYISKLIELLPSTSHSPRWMALQFFEGNSAIATKLASYIDEQKLVSLREEAEQAVAIQHNVRLLPQFIRQQRGIFIASILRQCVTHTHSNTIGLSEKIDRIVTNRYLGLPIFVLFMYLTFKLTFEWIGSPLSDLLDGFISGILKDWLSTGLDALGVAEFIKSVLLDGALAGVGGVLVFIPQIFMLFLIISFIEDSGYMARIATVMDKLMEAIGLNGKAFIPMIIGFGCNVPGIMAARSIEQPKERMLTILLSPLMSCSARLSVYSLFIGTFFDDNQALVALSLYFLGIVVALLLAKLFSSTILKQKESMFVVELPPYRIPQWRTLSRSTWEKGKGFIRKAGTFIFGGSVVIWLLGYSGPGGWNVNMNDSFLAMIGGVIAPLLDPLGFGNWQAGAALITGFLAKEVVVSTMNIIYIAPDMDTLQGMIANYFTPLQAYSFMAFILLYVPCLATVGVIRKETNSWRWTLFSIVYALIVAYLISLIIITVGHLLGFN